MATYTVTLNNYTYTLDDSTYTCSAVYNSTAEGAVSGLFDSILYNGSFYKLTSVKECFKNQTKLYQPPRIPNTVIDMEGCFSGCTKLQFPPKLPPEVTTLKNCFQGCTSLFVPRCFIVPASVTNMNYCFDGCTYMTKLPTILGQNVQMDYAFRSTAITDFRGLPRLANNWMYATAGSNSSIEYGSEELNYQAIEYSGMNTTLSSSPYYNSTISTWPKFTTVSGTMSIKALLEKLVTRANDLKSYYNYLISYFSYIYMLKDISFTNNLLNLIIYGSSNILKIPYYMSNCINLHRHIVFTDATSGQIVYHLRTSDGFCLTRAIHSPSPTSSTSRAGRTSSYTFYNDISKTYTSTAASLYGDDAIWKGRCILKNMRVGSTGTGLITINGQAANSSGVITFTYEAWGNSNGDWSDSLVAETFLQGTNSIDYTYNQTSWT